MCAGTCRSIEAPTDPESADTSQDQPQSSRSLLCGLVLVGDLVSDRVGQRQYTIGLALPKVAYVRSPVCQIRPGVTQVWSTSQSRITHRSTAQAAAAIAPRPTIQHSKLTNDSLFSVMFLGEVSWFKCPPHQRCWTSCIGRRSSSLARSILSTFDSVPSLAAKAVIVFKL